MDILITCKEGFEKILVREIVLFGLSLKVQGKGWILAVQNDPALSKQYGDLCFACNILEEPVSVSAKSVNSLAENLLNIFLQHIGSRKIAQPWDLFFFSSEAEQLVHHASTVKKCWFEKIQKRMSRVAKLAQEGIPQGSNFSEGFFVHFTDFNQAFVSFRALSQGQQRMKMDPQAPSRSYLKLEEAFHIFRQEPRKNDDVVDLGASPGGWSHSALKRGVKVTAIDNGPLKEPVKSHPKITHLKSDALTYNHDHYFPVDWLLCDVLEKPDIILAVLHKWLDRKWCRRFIVNLKLGRLDPIMVLKEIRDPQKGILPYCKILYVRQLYHDREEITLMGEAKG